MIHYLHLIDLDSRLLREPDLKKKWQVKSGYGSGKVRFKWVISLGDDKSFYCKLRYDTLR